MTHRIHISSTLAKKIKTMRKAGRKGELAANQSKRLLDHMQREGLLVKELYRKRTKNGEYRISGCIKYDLGHGYRMITIKDGLDIYVPFVGTHDETDLWLERHKYDSYHADDPAFEMIDASADRHHEREEIGDRAAGAVASSDQYEEQLLARVDETLLKSIFPGLFNKQEM